MSNPVTHHIKRKQYAVFAMLLIVTTVIVAGVYRKINTAAIRYRSAERLFKSGRYQQAIPLYETAFKAGVKNGDIRHLIAAYQKTGFGSDAFARFSHLDHMVRDRFAVSALVDLYASNTYLDEAIGLLKRTASLWDKDPAIMTQLADLYRRKKDYISAESWYRKAFGRSDGYLRARFHLAEMLAWQKRYKEAISQFQLILKTDPKERLARIHLARVLGWSGRLEEAIYEYQVALGEKP